jgi:hypothetical protein
MMLELAFAGLGFAERLMRTPVAAVVVVVVEDDVVAVVVVGWRRLQRPLQPLVALLACRPQRLLDSAVSRHPVVVVEDRWALLKNWRGCR